MDWITLDELNTLTNEEWTFLYGESVKNENEFRLETYHHSENFGHVRSFIRFQIPEKKFFKGIILNKKQYSSIDAIVSASELLDDNVDFFTKQPDTRLHFTCNEFNSKNIFSDGNQYIDKEKRSTLLSFSKEQEQQLFSWIQKEMHENFHLRFESSDVQSFYGGFFYKHKEIDKIVNVLKKFDIFSIEKHPNDSEAIKLRPQTAFISYSLPRESYLSILSELEHHTLDF